MTLKDLLNTPDLKRALQHLKKGEAPVVITKHGDPQGVLIPLELFEEYFGDLCLADMLPPDPWADLQKGKEW